ncbi:asparagine synthase-related protein [Streptomyces sp. NPDC001260]|uniref:asparagine synthase-related protein n=1 Tax=Streptomyces sp. NPDC001260 TaxID=3364551 RepID=UPI0036CCA113
MDRSRVLHHLPDLAARGSRLHLTGIGGDHVAWCSEAYYHRLLRTSPLFALRQLRGFRALWQWPLGGTVRALADSRPYGAWLTDAARRLRDPSPAPVATALGWGMAPRLFEWVTPRAEHMARRALLDAAHGFASAPGPWSARGPRTDPLVHPRHPPVGPDGRPRRPADGLSLPRRPRHRGMSRRASG